MQEYIKSRVIKHALMLLKRDATLRSIAAITMYGRQTIFLDVTERLKKIDLDLYAKVREKLDENKELRHLRGGYATQDKFIKLKERRAKRDGK